MFVLAMAKLLNTELIWDDPIVFKFIQIHENEEYQAVSLTKETKHILSFICNRYTKNNKLQEYAKFSNHGDLMQIFVWMRTEIYVTSVPLTCFASP